MRVSKILDSIFGVPKTLGSIFGGQQGNRGMELKVREYPPGVLARSYITASLAFVFKIKLGPIFVRKPTTEFQAIQMKRYFA